MGNTKKKQASAVAREASIGVRTAAGHIFQMLLEQPLTCKQACAAFRMEQRTFHRAMLHMKSWSGFRIVQTCGTSERRSSPAFTYTLYDYRKLTRISIEPRDPSALAAWALAQESRL